ncbi:MAG: hypothetical protein HKN29_16895, partial [Rhodothermales bacterium]|nr:hypothetical protein [Rhodothermales bacterium]
EVEPEERARLPIASRPFDLVKLYESVDQEQAVEPEDLREAELTEAELAEASAPEPQPEAELIAEPEAEPIAEPAAELIAEPEADPIAEPAAELIAEPEAELSAESEEDLTAEPETAPTPEVSIEPPTRKDRRRIQAMAELRPMSLADLIRQSQPRWTKLAEMD